MDDRSLIKNLYGKELRLRVCGICIQDGCLLLVRHSGLGPKGELWIPPGGGLEKGQSLPDNLKREFLEETGLKVEVGSFLFTHEHIGESLHAVELFFQVSILGGSLDRGIDPELPADRQIIQEVRFFSEAELRAMEKEKLHAMLQHYPGLMELNNASGYFKFGK